MKVTVYGSGYVGLVTSVCLAEVGHQVLCMDVNEVRVELLKKGTVPIHEPGLDGLLEHNLQQGRLRFTTSPEAAAAHGVIQFIAVGTPPDEDGAADLRHVRAVAQAIGASIHEYRLVCIKSTVPVGTADLIRDDIKAQLAGRGVDIEFDVASNPEFLKEGAAIQDFTKPDRIILGADHPRAFELLHELYAPFMLNHDCMITMDIRSAELTKYAANAMLAARISFMNELANIAERVGASIERVRVGVGSDPRIGYHFLYPGCGYGGSCFPKDVTALAQVGHAVGYTPELLHAIDAVNHRQKQVLFEKITRRFGTSLSGKRFALWGLAFKPNTDDMRDASSRTLMEALWDAGAVVHAFDPAAMNEARRIYGHRPDLILSGTKEETLRDADALVIVTEWMEFRSPDFESLRAALRNPIIFDGRNLYDPVQMARKGFEYHGIGYGVPRPSEQQASAP